MTTGAGTTDGGPLLPPPQLLSSTKTAAVTVPLIHRIGTKRVITPPGALLCCTHRALARAPALPKRGAYQVRQYTRRMVSLTG